MSQKITKVIACQVVLEEMLPYLPEGVVCEKLEFGLHANPDQLKKALQEKIDASNGKKGTILLGYGLCSKAIVGLKSETCTLVVPRVDDCIGIFLGSRETYLRQQYAHPGTYFLTKGWIEAGDSPGGPYEPLVKRYGKEKADRLIKQMLKNYKRLVFINTGQYEAEQYRQRSKEMADRLGLTFEEVQGSNALVKKTIDGPWDEDFVIVPPGREISFKDFYESEAWQTP